MSTKLRENITTRYGEADREIYQQVITLTQKNNIPKSRAQLLLVERGLIHTNNPGPLVKEVEKVYIDRTNKLVGGNDKGQRASDDKLTTPNEANSLLASEVKKSSNDSTSIGGWIALIALLVGVPLTGYLWDKYITR